MRVRGRLFHRAARPRVVDRESDDGRHGRVDAGDVIRAGSAHGSRSRHRTRGTFDGSILS